jgi:hypothetical protein
MAIPETGKIRAIAKAQPFRHPDRRIAESRGVPAVATSGRCGEFIIPGVKPVAVEDRGLTVP